MGWCYMATILLFLLMVVIGLNWKKALINLKKYEEDNSDIEANKEFKKRMKIVSIFAILFVLNGVVLIILAAQYF